MPEIISPRQRDGTIVLGSSLVVSGLWSSANARADNRLLAESVLKPKGRPRGSGAVLVLRIVLDSGDILMGEFLEGMARCLVLMSTLRLGRAIVASS